MLIITGLIFDLAGVIMLFKFPPLAPEHEKPPENILVAEAPDEADQDHKARQRTVYSRLSKVALSLLAIGFSLQILGIALPVGGASVTDFLAIVADLGTLVIGAGAVYISWTAYRNSRKHMTEVEGHAKLSVKPALSMWVNYPTSNNDGECTILLGNKGFGPAVFETMDYQLDDERVQGPLMDRPRSAISGAFRGNAHFTNVFNSAKGFALGHGETIELATFHTSMIDETSVKEALTRLTLLVTYRDIYGGRWKFTQEDYAATTEHLEPAKLAG